KNKWLYVMAAVTAVSVTFTSCEEELNNYAPERPIGGYSSTKEIAPDDLVAHWAFEGNVTDSVASLAGTGTNVTYAPGKKGQAYKGAANGYAVFNDAGAVIPALNSYTIAFWMNTPQAEKATGIFAINNNKDFWGNLDIYLESYVQKGVPNPDTLFLKVHMNNDNVAWKGQFTDAKIPAAVGKWVHIAATYNATTSKYSLYANGLEIGVNTAGNPANTKSPVLNGDDPATSTTKYGPLKFVNANALAFGAMQFQTNPSLTTSATAQDWATNFSGSLDEFRIYNRALPASDISALFKLETLGR
ncbi:MAG TPA: LamG domain-containing protein, partial [Sphingobacteriaceae bacterium]